MTRNDYSANRSVRSAAAEWLVRIQNDELSVEEIATWQQWLASNAAHREAFEQMENLWQGFERLPNRAPPEIAASTPIFRPRAALVALAAGLVAIAVMLGLLRFPQNDSLGLFSHVIAFETQSREHRELTLHDGSRLALGGESLALVDFDAAKRTVKLEQGEAFFEVAKDPSRPFVVRAGDATITAVGTAFNVRRAGERTDVVVTEGTVLVKRSKGQADVAQISAGHQLVLEPSKLKPNVQPTVSTAATAWRSGRLEYLGEPLKYVVADVNRYSTQQIVIGDPSVGELELTGTIFENDIEAWLRSVEALLPIEVDHSEPGKIVFRPR